MIITRIGPKWPRSRRYRRKADLQQHDNLGTRHDSSPILPGATAMRVLGNLQPDASPAAFGRAPRTVHPKRSDVLRRGLFLVAN
jgi:hypothetical protein